ncbi:MAG: aldo/keto reductase [Methyloceanibacter sp.]|uniref:aldo/keto reductase n=1 Tax=Methyloceanibacter sp. TaxID=1965321 RepID=UPI003D9BF64A
MHLNRRILLRSMAAAVAATALRPAAAFSQTAPLTKPVPSSGEALPQVGLGSWITFNVGDDPVARDNCAEVMRAFFSNGGRMIDSSPMYGSSQEVIGYGLKKLGETANVFSTDKVWTSSGADGPAQIEESRKHWGVPRFDLMQIHNLLAWEAHLETLFAMKEAGQLRYIGITTSHGRRHREMEKIMRAHPLDFIQLTYNVVDRDVEKRLLPLAREKSIAVIANRPFQQGALIRSLQAAPLPEWAGEIGARNWAQFLLKFIISHPSNTCAIPATSKVAHVRENMEAAGGPLPDEKMRRQMIAYVEEV